MDFSFLADYNWLERYKIAIIHCNKDGYGHLADSARNYGIFTLDFGATLAEWLEKRIDSEYLELETQEFVHGLVQNESMFLTETGCKTIAIHNLGILFEPALHINPSVFIKQLSVQYSVLLIWENMISDKGKLYWKDSPDKYYLDFSDIHFNYRDCRNEIQ